MKKINIKNFTQIFLASFLVLQVMLGYFPLQIAQAQLDTTAQSTANLPTYQGVDQSIGAYLCAPDESNLGTSLYVCIRKAYRFGVAFGAIALVFFVVLAGYLYITGGEGTKAKGKSMFVSALTGMVIILASYLLLSFINPDLIKIKPIQAPIFSASDLPSCEEVGFGTNCILPSGQVFSPGSTAGEKGQCTAANLSACTAWNVQDAIKICSLESKGDTAVEGKADPCLYVNDASGNKIAGTDGFAISYGLFQLTPDTAAFAFPECSGVLKFGGVSDCPVPIATTAGGTKYCPKRKCTAPKGIDALKKCVNSIKSNKEKQISTACQVYTKACQSGRGPFADWTTKEQLSSPSCTK